MAKRLNTDPATIVRIVQVLGFASFREFPKNICMTCPSPLQHLPTRCKTGGSDRSRYAYVVDPLIAI